MLGLVARDQTAAIKSKDTVNDKQYVIKLSVDLFFFILIIVLLWTFFKFFSNLI